VPRNQPTRNGSANETVSTLRETNLGKFGYFLGVPVNAPDKARFRDGLQPATMRELIASGELEMTSQWLPPEVMRALLEGGGTHLLADRGSDILFLEMNTRSGPSMT
jgi:peptide/nickel transport system substrate-binding protein